MKSFFWGGVVAILILIAVPVILASVGAFNMAATEGPGPLETTVAGWTVDRSVALRAPKEINPFQNDPEAIETGLIHYRAMCQQCHGAPNVKASEFAKGLNPPPPDLAVVDKKRTDGELFWIAKHGIRMTGMPAFGPTHSDEELWKIVAFVRNLDQLSESQVAALREGEEADHHQHVAADHAHSDEPAAAEESADRSRPEDRQATAPKRDEPEKDGLRND